MFGSLRVDVDGRVLSAHELGGVKPRQILEMLLTARGHAVSTDELAEGLWPSNQPRDVAATLNTYVSVLRHRLFDDQELARRVIVTASRSYRLKLDEITVDRDVFDDLMERAEFAPRAVQALLLQRAIDLAGGDLLEDSPYAPWALNERQIYHDRIARAHLVLARNWLLDGQATCALRYAEQALRLSPYSEEACRLIMISTYALGCDDMARAAFVRCKQTVGDDLWADVTSATASVAAAIDAGAPLSELLRDLSPADSNVDPVAPEPVSDRQFQFSKM